MKLQTQKISREMNCTTKVRSICTDKSMKNSGVHHWNCSACTDEQVNCPFCLLWERCLKPIFPRCIYQPYVLEKKIQLWKSRETDSFQKPGDEDESHTEPEKRQKERDHRGGGRWGGWVAGGVRSSQVNNSRFESHHQNCTVALPAAHSPSWLSTMLPAAHCKCIFTASLQMIQKPDVTGFLITF